MRAEPPLRDVRNLWFLLPANNADNGEYQSYTLSTVSSHRDDLAEWTGLSSDWFRDAFKDDYPLLYSARTEDQARIEVECVVRELEISPRDRVLDLCCGHGRHLEAFRRLGIPTTGVDLSLELLSTYRRRDAAERDRVAPSRPSLVRADMRALPLRECFDVVVNFFTSFGYFESEDDHAMAARELAGVLRPGGRFCMDLMNPDDAIRSLNPYTERRVGSLTIVERRRYDPRRKRIEKHIRLVDGSLGERSRGGPPEAAARSYHESVRLFGRHELEELLGRADLRIDRVLGDFSGAPYDGESPRLIAFGTKPER